MKLIPNRALMRLVGGEEYRTTAAKCHMEISLYPQQKMFQTLLSTIHVFEYICIKKKGILLKERFGENADAGLQFEREIVLFLSLSLLSSEVANKLILKINFFI